jgi:hypothetical protein
MSKVDSDAVVIDGGLFVGEQSIKALGGQLKGEALEVPHQGATLHYVRCRISGTPIVRNGRPVYDFIRITRGA